MSFLRFTLDVSPLDDEGYGLDGPGFAFTSDGVGVSTLGALTSAASSITIHEVSASAPLDGATGTATSLVTNPVSANAPLGGSYSNATAIVSVIATGGVSLGGLTASATAADNIQATAQAALGGLNAQIVTVSQTEGGSFGNPLMQFVQPNLELPKIEIPVIEPLLPKVHYGFADALLGRAYASALSQIDFSIVEDDAEILAML
jgi:hypothetical protein